jgi:uncharacterized protein YoxC
MADMTSDECRQLAKRTNQLLEDINIRLASLNLIFYGDDPVTQEFDMQKIISLIRANNNT